MKGLRKARVWLLVAATAAAACGPIDEGGFASDVERELEGGRAYAAGLLASTRTAPTAEATVQAGYLERLRLGLGSPFRLIEHALQDPRISKDDRERLAWSLLAATLDGRAYEIDPGALFVLGGSDLARRHIELADGAIRGTADPDGGMLAVRLAYVLATAEGVVPQRTADGMSRVAALLRDRVVSRDDARRLLRAAGSDRDPMSLLTVWRVERRFRVESPPRWTTPDAVEREGVELAPRLLAAIRGIRPAGVGPIAEAPPPPPAPRPVLGPDAARVLAGTAAAYDAPPQTPVAVAVGMYRSIAAPASPALDGFFDAAVNEERLAAEYAKLRHAGEATGPARRAVMAAAVALRAYNQERPWFPGFDGPTRRDLEDRFGLAEVAFPEDAPVTWRPYYRRMLESALSDLQRVLPSLDVRGLKVRFESRAGSSGTLAVHDPRTRTVHIPPVTGAGTIAHEIAHDMDWQTALRRYRVRGDYGTDRATRLSDERIARVLRGLTTAELTPAGVPNRPTSHATRPAEVFARSVDWFVAVALAREGRMNGYLSSVQDAVITGYGTVTPPDVTGAAGQALMALLDEVAPVYPETRRWFLGSYGRLRAPTAYDLARRVMEAPLDVDAAGSAPKPARMATLLARLDRLEAARDSALAMVDGACRAVAYDDGTRDVSRRLIKLTTEARARGLALELAGDMVGDEGRDWLGSLIDGRSRDPQPDSAVVEVLTPLAERVQSIGGSRVESRRFEPDVPTTDCGPLPFIAD